MRKAKATTKPAANGKPKKQLPKKPIRARSERPPEEWHGYTSRSVPVNLTPTLTNLTADHVVSRRVEWLVEDYIPYGFVTMLTGESESGKSTLLGALAASVTRGIDLRDGKRYPPGKVLVYSPEEDPAVQLKPRWVAHDAVVSSITLGDYAPDGQLLHRMLLPADAKQLGRNVAAKGYRLVIIDPITAYLGGASEVKDDVAVRSLLDAIQAISQETGCALVVTRHPRKSREGTALDRVAGNAAWTQHPRIVLATGRDPESEQGRVLAVCKNSFRLNVPSREFTIEIVDGAAVLHLGGNSKVSAKDIGAEAESLVQRDALGEAIAFLQEQMKDGPKPQKEIGRVAADNRISEGTLRRAKVKLGVTSHPVGANGERYQEWRPPNFQPS